jgi:hypothetical protein
MAASKEYNNKPTSIISTENFFIKSPKEISGKQALLMIPLTKFFCNKYNIDKLQETVNNKNGVSLRLIDWFVTNYSKKNNIMYNKRSFDTQPTSKILVSQASQQFNDYFNVFNDYKSQLKSFSKKHFDPFCRRLRIHFYYSKDKYIITTVGQLNFFKWAIENNIIEYIKSNIIDIENDMNSISLKQPLDKVENVNIDTELIVDDIHKPHTNSNDDNDADADVVIIKSVSSIPKKKNYSNGTKTKQSRIPKKQQQEVSQPQGDDKEKEKDKKTLRKKRRELSESMSKSIIKHNYSTIITFD